MQTVARDMPKSRQKRSTFRPSEFFKNLMENRQNEEAQQARKAKKESKKKWAAEEENICANVQAAQAAAEAVLKTPFMKQTSSATSKKQRTPTQRLVAGAQGEGSGEVMSPRA